MYSYALKKLIHSVIVLLAVITTVFLFQSYSVVDSVDDFLSSSFGDKPTTKVEYELAYKREAIRQNKNLPLFYFNIVPNYFPDTLHRIILKEDCSFITEMLRYSHCRLCTNRLWEEIQSIREVSSLDSIDNIQVNTILDKIKRERHWNKLSFLFDSIVKIKGAKDDAAIDSLLKAKEEMNGKRNSMVLPKFLWHGTKNQYHRYISNVFRGELGRSKSDGRDAGAKIKKALKWTLSMNLMAFLLAGIIGLIIGLWSTKHHNYKSEKVTSSILFFVYTMPVFWTATLAVVFFTTERYGSWMDIFPSTGIKYWYADKSVAEQIVLNAAQLVLPVICITVPSLAYMSRIMKSKFSEVLSLDFITALRAKGISERSLYNKHVLKNGLIPYITILTGSIPGLFAGSLVIEIIFGIPGIGKLLLDAIYGSDWAVISGLVILLSIVTVLAYLLADILYSWANPRISLT